MLRTRLVSALRTVRRIVGVYAIYWAVKRPFWHLQVRALRRFSTRTFSFRGTEYRYHFHPHGLTQTNERSVEIPIASAKLRQYHGRRILEIGNVLSHHLRCCHDVVDKYEKAPGVLNFDVVDINPDLRYDLIISVSTIEHVGKDEREVDEQKAIRAVGHLMSLLNEGGELFATFPLGYHRVLDDSLLRGALPFADVGFLQRVSRHTQWEEVSHAQARGARYGEPFRFGNTVVIASTVAGGTTIPADPACVVKGL